MPTLNWIGKEAVVNHHLQVPFHLLKDVPELACGNPGEGNLIVQGDNLVALKALLPYYAGQVKCIYIDPPYNTGNESWVYNDNVSSPVIREWLGKVVGKEGETLDRHDRWLCMMYPRLVLLKQFLRQDGAIFVSIDDNEAASLRLLMDEIFGTNNFLCAFAWEKRYSPPPDTKGIGYLHETLLAYRRSTVFNRNLLMLTNDQTGRYKNPDSDARGEWQSMDYTCRYTADERPNLFYPITQPNSGEEIWPKRTRVWSMSREVHERNIADNRIYWGVNGTNTVPRLKNFLSEIQQGMMPVSLLKHEVAGHTDEAAKELRELVPWIKFTPKPTRLIQHLLKIATDKNSLILDSFAGSGTTGHAVLKQNAEDGGNRRFILVEMDDHIARNVTTERVRRVAGGYTNAKSEHVAGLGGGFRYCELGEPLFDEHGKIRDSVRFADLARHVYFTETGEPLPRERVSKSALLGDCRGVGIYLLYNGILGDKSANGGNVLTRAVLAQLPPFAGPKVVYCAGCLLGRDRLRAENIIVRQTPYEIKVS